MAYVVMAYVVMVYIVIVYIVMSYTVMAYSDGLCLHRYGADIVMTYIVMVNARIHSRGQVAMLTARTAYAHSWPM